jgi:heparan-alpha-glucosaminide N-acetyltransferase
MIVELRESEQILEPTRVLATPQRDPALDAYRGFVMFLMMAEVLRLSRVAAEYPGNWLLASLAWNQTHVAWAGCSLHDLIQPSFSFLVGAALPYSIGARLAKGGTLGVMFRHALWRSLILVALGIFLRSTHSPITNFTFEDTLTQIGLGYPILFLLGFASPRWQWSALGFIVVGYWLAWALYPVQSPAAGMPPDWFHYTGFAAHWNKNVNLGSDFDVWFLNLFPRVKPFVFNDGGYLTLSFIPTLGTMVLGLIAGRWLKDGELKSGVPYRRFFIAGAVGLALGAALHFSGFCPVVKRIWTPSWVLFSGGACFLLLSLFCRIGSRRWVFPLIVIGMNSIAAYLIAHLWDGFFTSSLKIHFGWLLDALSPGGALLITGPFVLTCFWLTLYWMYKRKLFLRI